MPSGGRSALSQSIGSKENVFTERHPNFESSNKEARGINLLIVARLRSIEEAVEARGWLPLCSVSREKIKGPAGPAGPEQLDCSSSLTYSR
jgi:hypothetical protein